MKDGREKVGSGNDHKIDGPAAVLQLPKMRRLTLPFGPVLQKGSGGRSTLHEHYIREIPLAGGGLGCALWDGGLVLARWVYKNGHRVFSGRTVLELGCGVGLAGIMAAHWASNVILTDYIQDTVDNALYNVKVNCGGEDDDNDGGDYSEDPSGDSFTWNIAERVSARVLDWDLELAAGQGAPSPSSANDEHDSASKDESICTLEKSQFSFVQPWFWCRTCWPSDDSCGVCVPCGKACHSSHELLARDPAKFKCDCRKRQSTPSCSAVVQLAPIDAVDIIIGSELTYNLLSTKSLAFVVNKYLKPGGVFYEVLSDDRDGVSQFAAEMSSMRFTMKKVPAGGEFVGQFGTRKWSKQESETYSFYTWRKPTATAVEGDGANVTILDSSLPDMTA